MASPARIAINDERQALLAPAAPGTPPRIPKASGHRRSRSTSSTRSSTSSEAGRSRPASNGAGFVYSPKRASSRRGPSKAAHRAIPYTVDDRDEMAFNRAYQRRERRLLVGGALAVLGTGLVLGFATPDSAQLPRGWSRFSNVIGWTYFAAWSLSFYPQVYWNYIRKSVVGLSLDYQMYNVIGFTCYSLFNAMLYWSGDIQDAYKRRHHGKDNPVKANDVVFALHALLLTFITVYQIFIYDRGTQTISNLCQIICAVLLFLIAMYAAVTLMIDESIFTWLDFLNFLADIKLGITFVKYFPQIILNFKRKSTVGCNIHNFLLDFTGGVLSVAQLLMDAHFTHDWTAITGDIAKFGLGTFAMVFDTIVIIQHYVLYTDREDPAMMEVISASSSDRDRTFSIRSTKSTSDSVVL